MVSTESRWIRNGYRSGVFWLTGLSGAGKSTLAFEIERLLINKNIFCSVLDGDIIRNGLSSNLGFSKDDRKENMRRVSEVAKLLANTGIVTIVSLISPFEKERMKAKEIIGGSCFSEIYIKCPLEICESRDVKGLYKKARNGQICEFTGITSPYEPPKSPNLTIDTSNESIESSYDKLLSFILERIKI